MATPIIKKMSPVARACMVYVIVLGVLFGLRVLSVTNVGAGRVGVRFSTVSGVLEDDLGPGMHWRIPFVHRVYDMPSRYLFINYYKDNVLTVRTKDNNTVHVDVSIPYRIKPGEAWRIARAGNHLEVASDTFRFQEFARRAADDVLLAELAKLSSEHFYDTETRLKVSDTALRELNEKLADYHLEADAVLIRQAYFRKEYEKQLEQIQLNEQTKLLDAATGKVALQQQELDNYNQGTAARLAAKTQDWVRLIANLERAYMVGSIDTGDDHDPGATRRALAELSEDQRTEIGKAAGELLGVKAEDIGDSHLIGIRNIQAATIEYKNRVHAEADGVAARLKAEGDAKVAKVQGAYERRVNELLDSPGGRAYVAYNAAANVKFADTLTFQSRDGIPTVYRLRDFARKFMGQ